MPGLSRTAPPLRVKLLFWLILASLSSYLAEGVSGAGLYPLLHPWWVLVCLPLYGLHILVLATVIYRWGRARFPTLLLAGFVFGMYEAYLTKVVWSPTWGPSMLSLGGIATVETAVISFFWHPILAFIIPVVIGERVFTRSRESWDFLPLQVQRVFRRGPAGFAGLVALAVACGAFQSFNSPSPLQSVLSGVSSFGVLALLFHAWFRLTRGRTWPMRDLLPGPTAFRIMLGLLLAIYIVFGIGMRREALPGWGPQAIVWGIYAILFALLFLSLRRSARMTPTRGCDPEPFSWRAFLAVSLALTLTSAGLNFVPGNHVAWIVAFYWVFGTAGLALFLFAARDALRPVSRTGAGPARPRRRKWPRARPPAPPPGRRRRPGSS
ncbi:MAG: hypothetical protein AAB152_11050 [Candidatus Coatesbacteria bacterium]